MMKIKPTILWADDDVEDREIFREVLEAHTSDHVLIDFENGMELIQYLQRLDKKDFPCLIVLDLNMPVLGGKETLVMLKDDPDFKHIPAAVFTTSDSPSDKKFCERFNVQMFTKPPDYNQIKIAVERVVNLCTA